MRSDKRLLASADAKPAAESQTRRLPWSARPSAEPGTAIRLFALASHDFALARRHEGEVETEVERQGIGDLAFDDAAFIPGYLALESPAAAFYRLEARRRPLHLEATLIGRWSPQSWIKPDRQLTPV